MEDDDDEMEDVRAKTLLRHLTPPLLLLIPLPLRPASVAEVVFGKR